MALAVPTTKPAVGPESWTVKVSSLSSVASLVVATVTTLTVSPAAKVTVPLVAAKSLSAAVALPLAVA